MSKKNLWIPIVFFLICIIGYSIFAVASTETATFKSYDEETKTVTLKNAVLQTIAEIKLLSEQHRIVFPESHAFEIEITLYKDSLTNFLTDMELYEKEDPYIEKLGNKITTETFTYSYYDEDYEQSREVCNYNNATKKDDCKTIITVGKWLPLVSFDNLPIGKTRIRSYYSNLKEGETVEWIPSFLSKRVEEFADFSGASLFEHYRDYDNEYDTVGATRWIICQGIKVGNFGPNLDHIVEGISLKIGRGGADPTTATFSIKNRTSDGVPASDWAVNTSCDITGVSAGTEGEWFNISLGSASGHPPSDVTLVAGGEYYVCMEQPEHTENIPWRTNYTLAHNMSETSGAGPAYRYDGSWTVSEVYLFVHEVWGIAPPQSAPNITYIYINETAPNTNSVLDCNATVYDEQAGDTLSLNITWYNETEAYSSYLKTGMSTGDTANFTLTPQIQHKDETWNCSAFANDGTVDGPTNSTTVTILNIAPTQGTPLLNSSDPTLNDTNANLTCYNISTADTEGDTVKSIYNWFVYNFNIFVVNMPFEINATDYSGRGNHGTVNGATFSSTAGVDGRGAYIFSAVPAYIEIADNPYLDFNQTTISMWIKTSNQDEVIIEKWETTGDQRSWKLETNVAGLLTWSIDPVGNGASVTTVYGNSNLGDGEWHNIIAIHNTTSMGVFVDGVLQNEEKVDISIHQGTAPITIGGISGSSNFTGTIDDLFIIYGSGISANQASAIYNNQTNLIHSDQTSDGETWMCGVTPTDGINDGVPLNSSSLTILSYVPSITNISIYPNPSYTDTTIDGRFTGTDLNDDPITFYCDFYNGSTFYSSYSASLSIDTEHNFTLSPAGIQHKNEVWNFSCNATDGSNWASINSTTLTISNTAPTTPSIGGVVNNTRVTGNSQTLRCENSTDVDGDTIYSEFYADLDTNPATTLKQNTTDVTYALTTIDGGTYWWRCKANDAQDTSGYTTTKQFTENNLSLVHNVSIDPSTVYGNSTLNGSTTAFDNDGDSLTVNMTWWNGTTYYSSYSKTSVSSGSIVNYSLTEGIQHEGETWNFSVIVYDGYEFSEMNSTTITISNALPIVNTPTITPANIYSNSTLVNCSTTAYDIDIPETLYVNITWYNGTEAYSSSYIETTTGVLVSFQLLPSLIQHVDEIWNCSARAYDGTDYSELNPSTTKTILNLAPTTPTLISPPTKFSTDSTSVTLNCSLSTDVDNDTIYYEIYGDASSSPTTLLQNSTSNTYSWSGLTPDTYWWRCRANDQKSSSAYTDPWWFANIEGGAQINITCQAGLTEIMSFNFENENNLTSLNVSIDYNLKFNTGGTGNATINGSLSDIGSFSICMNTSISNAYEVAYGEIKYQEEGYTTRRYYLFAGDRLAIPKVEDTLFLLPNADATSFLFEFKSTALVPYENHYGSLLRWYPDLDTYDTVEMGKTDNKGQTIMRVVTEDVDYRIGVYEADGTLVKLLDPIKFACLASPCSYSALVEAVALDYTSIYGIASNLVWLGDTFRFTYNDPSQKTSQIELKVYKDTGTSSIEICSDTATGYTGIITCNVSAYTGTLRAIAYRTASPTSVLAQKIIQTTSTIFKGTVGLFVSFIIFLILVFIGGGISPVLAIFFGIIALIPAVALGSITLSIFIGIGILGGLVIHFMKRVG